MSSKKLRVAVSGIHLGENCQPGAGVIRSLRESIPDEVEIVGIAYDAMDSSLFVPGLLDDAYLMPYPSAGPRAYLEALLAIKEEGGLDVIVPCLDVELPLFQGLLPRLRELGIALALPTPESFARRSKDRLPELARSIGVKVPDTLTITDLAGLSSAASELGYPLVVKGPFYEAEVVRGPADATQAFQKLAAKWGLPLLAQRFVKGEEFCVIALGDGEGGCHGPVAMRKTIVTRLGKAWGAVTIVDDELLETARHVVGALGWKGGCEVEMLRATDGGKLHLIEVNPRFPAWVYLATAAGSNLALGLLRLALGEPLPLFESYRPGVWYVRHAAEAVGVLEDVECLLSKGRVRRSSLKGAAA